MARRVFLSRSTKWRRDDEPLEPQARCPSRIPSRTRVERGIDGVVIGRIFLSPGAPQGRPWMWTCGHYGDLRRSAYGYEPTRERAMQAFARSWRRE